MKWLLIFVVWADLSHPTWGDIHNRVTYQEFKSKGDCELVAKETTKLLHTDAQSHYKCVTIQGK